MHYSRLLQEKIVVKKHFFRSRFFSLMRKERFMSYSRSPVGGSITQQQSGLATVSSEAKPQGSPSNTSKPDGGPSRFLTRYRQLMIIFFCLFLVYLLYLQTRNDVGNNGVLRAISDLFVLFGSMVCTLVCGYGTFSLRRTHTALAGLMAGRSWMA